MAAIATVRAGNWSDTSTSTGPWPSGILPTSADDVTLNHALTWDATFTIKSLVIKANQTSGANTGLTYGFAANATITQGAGVQNITVTIGAGNTVAGVNGSPFVWMVGNVYNPLPGMVLLFNGSSGSHCVVRDGRFTYDNVNVYTGTGIVRATFTDFLRVGDATNPAIRPNQQGFANPFTIYDCTFDTCGALANPSSLLAGDTFDVRRTTWKNTPAGVLPINVTNSVAMVGGVRNVTDCVFDLFPKFATVRDFTIDRSVFWKGISIVGGGVKWASANQLFYRDTTLSVGGIPQMGDMVDPYFWCDNAVSQDNPHYLVPDPSIGDVLLDGAVFEMTASGGNGDCWLGFGPTIILLSSMTLRLNQGAAYTTDSAPPYHLLGTPGTASVGDAYYFGMANASALALTLLISTPAVATGMTLAWEYWNGTAWAALPGLVDGSGGLTVAGRSVVSWTAPAGWASTTVSAVSGFFVRLRVAALTILTQSPVVPQLVMSALATPTATYTMRRCIVLPGRDGNDAGTLMTLHGDLNSRFIIDHNTYFPGVVAAAFGESYNGYPGMIVSFRGNLAWNTTLAGYKLWDSGHLGSGAGIITDIGVPANIDYNGGYRVQGTYTGSVPWLTNQGNGYVGAFSATPGAHDVNGVDPLFVDKTRNAATWDVSLGGDGSSAHILAQFQAKNPAYTAANLIAHIRGGFVPQAAAYKNASYPGDPLMADIGAVAAGGAVGPGYTLSGPLVLDIGTAGTITATLSVPAGSTVTITPHVSGVTGTFSPSSMTISAGGTTATCTFTPAAAGTASITATNSGSMIDPGPLSYVVTGFRAYRPVWEANMRDSRMLSYWAGLASPAPVAQVSQVLMYDPVDIWEQIRAYTGDTSIDTQVGAALYQWRDSWSLPAFGGLADYNNNTRGMRNNYVRTGDMASRAAIMIQSVNCIYASDATDKDYMFDQNASRPCAMAIMSMLDAEDAGATHRPRLDHLVRVALGHCDQWLLPEASWATCQYLQPFMVGITLRSLIAYWDRYRDAGVDTQVAPSVTITGIPAKVKAMLDLLWTGSNRGIPYWFPDQDFPNRDFPAYPFADGTGYPIGPPGTGAFGYFYPDTQGNTPVTMDASCTAVRAAGGGSPAPSAILNQYVAPAMYWYWWYTAKVLGVPDDNYRQRGDAIFSGAQSSVAGQFNGLPAAKSFNENYFWSIPGVGWRDRVTNPPAATTGLTVTAPAPASGPAAAPSGLFRVSLSPAASVCPNPVTVTPACSGGGRSIPAKVILTTDRPTQVFRVVPAAASAGGNVTVTVTNDGGFSAPAGITYAATSPAQAQATGYAIAPTSPAACGPHLNSDTLTVSLVPAGSVPGTAADVHGGMVAVAFGDNYAGGSFTPKGTWIESGRATATGLYYPGGTAARSLYTSVMVGYTPPAAVPFSPLPTDYTITKPVPASGPSGVVSAPFTVALAHGSIPVNFTTNLPDSIRVNLAVSGVGGSVSVPSVVLTNAAPSGTFTLTPATAGTVVVTPSASAPYTSDAPVAYAADSGTVGGGGPPDAILAILAAGGCVLLPSGRMIYSAADVPAAEDELVPGPPVNPPADSGYFLAVIAAGGTVMMPSGRSVRANPEVPAAMDELN